MKMFENLNQEEIIDRLCSYESIRQLVANYAHLIDSKDLKGVTELFIPEVRASKESSGREALEKVMGGLHDEIDTTILKVSTHKIDFQDSDNATGLVYAHGDIQMGDRWLHQTIRYGDKYVRKESSWFFVGRKHQIWYSVDVGKNPLDYPLANWPENNIGLGDLI